MRIRTVPWVGFVVLGLAALAGAGEPPKDKPKDPPKGDPGAKQPAEPPAAPKPAEDPAKPAPGLINVLLEIERNLKSDEVGKRAKAVQDLVKADSEEPPLLEKIKNLLTLVCNSTHFVPDHRQMAAERICAMAVKHREKASLEFDKKIKAILEAVLTNEKQNADPRVCLPLLRHLLDLGQPEALKLAQSCLKNFKPEGATALLALLRVSANPMVLDVIIEIANDKAGKNLVLRRDCVKWLGLWGNLPPTYAKRIPALLEALDSPATTEAALEALHRICIPSLEQAQAWKNWWKQAQGKDDAAVVREDLKEVFERKTKDEKELGAQRIIEWLGDWNGPCFRWAVPLLLDPLLKYDHGEIRSRVISILGTIGDASAVAPLETLSREIKPEKQSQRVQLREVILGMARIAAPGDEAKRTEVGKTLEVHLDSIHEDIVAAAAEAMGLLRYAPSRNRLVVVLNKTSSMRAAMKAAEALGQMKAQDCLAGTDGDGNLRILPMLAKCLDQSDLT
ncbi:MAG: hypothetical protein MUC63_08230, partial [Planctomycetes bacterium]|nr:hypothetical protein [Planctomycetota bacterium]